MFYIRSKLNKLCNNYSKRRTCVITINVSKKIISECFEKFEDLKHKDETYKLSEYKFINQIIELKKNKSFLDNLIYFLSESELKFLKKYLNKRLKNNFILFFQSLVEAFILFVKKITTCFNFNLKSWRFVD